MTAPNDGPGFGEERESDNIVNLEEERKRRLADVAAEVERLAKLSESAYIAEKKSAADKLKITQRDLEKLVNAKRVKPPKDGFEMRKDGLYKREKGELRLVSQPFEVVMKVRDLSLGSEAGGWGIKIKFGDEYGVEREASASIGHLHQDPNAAVGLLAECGLRVEGTKTARLDLAQFLIAAKSKNKSSIVRRTGWIDAAGTTAFVMPDRIIGIETDEHLIWPPEAGPNPQADKSALAKVPYTVAGGAGKGRLNRASEAIAIRHWRTLFSSSGEASFEALIAKEQEGEALAGQTVRVIDIRVAEDEGRGVFELSPDFNPAKFAEQMERASSTWFGTAGPEFVHQLIESKIGGERVIAEIDCFTNEALGDGNGGQVGRAAKRFALVAAAGELAIEFGVLPWPKGDAKAAALDLFKFWIADRGGMGPSEKASDIARVRRFIESDGEARCEDAWAPKTDIYGKEIRRPPVVNRAGFRRGAGEDGKYRRWYILPEQFKRICAPRSPTDVARHLDEIGALERSDNPNDRNLTRHVRIPGVGMLRLYVITPSILEGWSDGDDGDDGDDD